MDPRFEIQTCQSLLSDGDTRPHEEALTSDEWARAHAIVSPARRDQFLAGRWLAKKMLVEAYGGSPADWRISADGHGKPVVIGHDLQLSIAHSGPFVACCIADHAAGIDVERLGRARPIVDMAALVCSVREQNALRALQDKALVQRFFQLWTCKEARLKQLGLPFDVTVLSTLQMEQVEGVEAQAGTWYFSTPQNVMLSLAVEGLPKLHTRWPAPWVAGPVQWHRYI